MKNIFSAFKAHTRGYNVEASYSDNEWYDRLWSVYEKKDGWTRLRLAQVDRMVSPSKGDRIVDFGCASGAISHYCATKGASVTGIDSSPTALEYAQSKCEGLDCRFIQEDVSNVKVIPDNSIDKVVTADLIEHLEDTVFKGMMNEAFRILKPGGTVSIYTPNLEHIIERMKDREIIFKQNVTHIAVRTPAEVEAFIKRAGFEIDLSYTTVSHFPVFNILEFIFKYIPFFGKLCRYRICVRGIKPSA